MTSQESLLGASASGYIHYTLLKTHSFKKRHKDSNF